MNPDISVVIATIPTRGRELAKALRSVALQTLQPAAIHVEYDHQRTGGAATKNRGIAAVSTPWLAMLDDDDVFMPDHLLKLRTAAQETGADVVYSMPLIPQRQDGLDPNGRYGLPFDATELRRRSYIQTTSLIRTEAIHASGGFQCPAGSDYDDWGCFLALLDRGAMFHHVAEQTFVWNHTGYGVPGRPGNTSGRGDRW